MTTKQPELELQARLLDFFKLFADVARLQIAGALATAPATAEELAAQLALPPAVIGRHLGRLIEAGLVSEASGSDGKRFQFDTKAHEASARRIFAELKAAPPAPQSDEEKLFAAIFDTSGRLRQIPSQRSNLEIMLRRLVESFDHDRSYAEPEVNEILGRFHEDTAYLRRLLVDWWFMERQVESGKRPIYRRRRSPERPPEEAS